MKLNLRHVGMAMTLLVLAFTSWWLSRIGTGHEIEFTGKQRHDPDYIVENFYNTVMTPQGRPEYELRGKRLVHYGDDGSSTVEQPYLIQYVPDQAPTHARAKEGYLPEDTSYIRLTGDVNVTRGRDPRSAGGEIRAETMTLQLDKSRTKKPK